MSDKQFDRFIKNALYQHESSIPSGLWERIANEEDKKAFGYWWQTNKIVDWGISIFILLIATISFINEDDFTKNVSFVNRDSTLAKRNLSFNNQNINHSLNSKSRDDNQNILNIENSGLIASNSTKLILTATPNNDIDKIDKGKSIRINKSTKKEASNLLENTTSKRFNANQDKNRTNTIVHLIRASKVSLNKKSSSEKLLKNHDEIQGQVQGNSNHLITYSENSYNNIQQNQVSSLQQFKGEIQIPSIQNTFNQLSERSINKLSNNNISTLYTKCPSISGSLRNDWYLELYASPEMTTKKIVSNGASKSLINKIDSSEQMQLGFSAGIGIAKNLTEHLLFKTGLQYHLLNELQTIRTENERKTTTVIITKNIIRPQGDTIVRDTSSITEIGYRIAKTTNEYKSIEIPIILGYEFGGATASLKAAINTGLVINIANWYNGKTLDSTNFLTNPNVKNTKGLYGQSTSYSLYLGTSIIKRISNNLEAYLEPYTRIGLSNSVTNTVGFFKRFNNYGLNFGVRFKLNGNNRQRN